MTMRIDGPFIIGTAADFASQNPVLVADEMSLETDTGIWKRGDGTTAYTSLARVVSGVPSGDEAFPVGKGPIVHDDADGHTYRFGTHNGAATVTLVT